MSRVFVRCAVAVAVLAASVLGAQVVVRPGGVEVRPQNGAQSIQTAPVGPAGGGPVTSSLLTGLTSVWQMTSTTVATDSLAANNLTNNGVTFAAVGPLGTVAKYTVANTEFFSVGASAYSTLFQSDCTVQFWAYSDTLAVERYFLSYDAAAGPATAYYVSTTASSFLLTVNDIPFTASTTVSTGANTVIAGKWYFVTAGRSGSNIFIQLNDQPRQTTALTITPGTGAGSFFLGARRASYGFADAKMGRVGVWSGRALSKADADAIYNNGRGKAYADLTTAEKVNLSSYWNLTEPAGNRADSHGAVTLVDNNTVLNQVTNFPGRLVAKFTAASLETLTVPTPTALKELHTRSWAVWYRTDDPGAATHGVISVADTAISSNPIFDVQETASNYQVYHHGAYVGTAPKVSGWNFLVFTYDHGTGTWVLYRNGANVGTAVSLEDATKADDNIFVGSGFSAYWNDLIGPVGAWSSVIDQSTVTSLYNGGLPKLYSSLTAGEKTNMVSYWNMTEASGNRADSHGSNTLVDTNTVASLLAGTPANLPGTFGQFVQASNQYMSIADNASLSLGNNTPFQLAVWVHEPVAGIVSQNPVIEKWGGGGVAKDYEYSLRMVQNATMDYAGTQIGDGVVSTGAKDTFSNPVLGRDLWSLVMLWHDLGTNTVSLQVNGGTVYSSVALTGNGTFDGNGTFAIGKSGSFASFFAGLDMSNAMFWNGRVLTSTERACLWNNGAAAIYPFTGVC